MSGKRNRATSSRKSADWWKPWVARLRTVVRWILPDPPDPKPAKRKRSKAAASRIPELRAACLGLGMLLGALLLPRGPWAPDLVAAAAVNPIAEVIELPEWLSADVEGSIRSALEGVPRCNLRNTASVDATLAAISTCHPWLVQVKRAEKQFPDQLSLALRVRVPVALVSTRKGPAFVDDDGVVLGLVTAAPDLLQEWHLPLISSSVPIELTAGAAVERSDLLDGLLVSREIRPFQAELAARRLDVVVIDVSPKAVNGRRLSHVDLITRDSLRVEWGRAKTAQGPGSLEYPPKVKVQNLLRAAAEDPAFSRAARVRLQLKADRAVLIPRPRRAVASTGA